MSLGLLGAYNSDSENSENSEDSEGVVLTEKTQTFKNPFISNEDDDSDSENEQEVVETDKEKDKKDDAGHVTLANPFMNPGLSSMMSSSSNWLPKPSFMQDTEKISGVKYDNSVFSNPFRAKEDKKEAILTQHVGVTVKPEAGTMFNGKKVCMMFRKGRCRHGHKCKFAHDNDVSKAVTDSLYAEKKKYDETSQISSDKQAASTRAPLQMASGEDPHLPPADEAGAGDGAVVSSGKKKRPGLSDGLVPSKKAMKFHNKVYN